MQSSNTTMSTQTSEELQPILIFSPADLARTLGSDLEYTEFPNPLYREIADLLERLAVVERSAEVKLRAWKHEREVFRDLSRELQTERDSVRKRLHDIFLKQHNYPHGPQIVLMPSDVYKHRDQHSALQFRDRDMENLVHNIGLIAAFEQELESYLTRQDGLEQGERQAMIRNTIECIRKTRDHLTKILTGYYDKCNPFQR
jgi:hypothetical protein